MFDVNRFESLLKTDYLGRSLFFLETCKSTNSLLKEIDYNEFNHGSLAISDFQTAGRGQEKNKWQSEKATNLLFSVGLIPPNFPRLNLLRPLFALTIADLLKSCFQLGIRIKWPNDIYISNRKLCGILTEATFNGYSLKRFIIGFGINVNQKNFGDKLTKSATSLSVEVGETIDREWLLAELCQNFERTYIHWERRQYEWLTKFNQFLIGYQSVCDVVVDKKNQYQHVYCNGLKENGTLEFKTIEGTILNLDGTHVRIYPH